MKVTHNDDGTVTVSIPKADERYDVDEAALFIDETLSLKDFNRAAGIHSEPKAAAPAKKRSLLHPKG